ncbi:MAG: hypothetical protein AMJ81_00195 [Phycisphaerae bacterium SM23_33]|nr:MAG: hypothetical protein AMJ81_00195 [Phycisphaerae bacterium SM23_33]
MRESVIDFFMAYLQDDLEHLAAFIALLFAWNCINTFFVVLVAMGLDSTHGALRRLAFKVTGKFDLE